MHPDGRRWALALLVCGAGLGVRPGDCADIRHAPGPAVTVQLMDVSTGQPARNAAVRVISDNGTRCMRAPCPTQTKIWKGTSDSQGRVRIPTDSVQTVTDIQTESLSGDLIEDSEAASEGTWVVELLPLDSTYADPPGRPRPLKLIDAATGKAVADAAASFELRRGGGSQDLFKIRTNAFGYVFLPNDLPDGALQNTWVIVAGYGATHVDFAWAAHRTRLARRPRRSQLLPQ